MKNFNKDCIDLISGKRTSYEMLQEKQDELSDMNIRAALRRMTSNKIASLVLFWIELKRRSADNKLERDLKFNFSLEHIMPQRWSEFGPITCPQVVEAISGEGIEDGDKAITERQAAVFELGNMTLLLSSLNTSLRNYELSKKIKGEGKKRGIEYYASNLTITKEILDTYNQTALWNEHLIRIRTESLTADFLKIW